MRGERRIFWALLVAALALGCAGTGATQPKLVWVRDDGTPAERAELIAARNACFETVNASAIPLERRWGHVEYAGQVVDCIKSKGYHLVEATEE